MNEDASEQYDRQIRLWGVDAQKRMSGSKVLFSGINGVSESTHSNRGKKITACILTAVACVPSKLSRRSGYAAQGVHT